MTLTVCLWMGHQIKNIFMEKSCRKYAEKASPRPLYNFGKSGPNLENWDSNQYWPKKALF